MVVVVMVLVVDVEMCECIEYYCVMWLVGFEIVEVLWVLSVVFVSVDDVSMLIVVDCLMFWLVNWFMLIDGVFDVVGW